MIRKNTLGKAFGCLELLSKSLEPLSEKEISALSGDSISSVQRTLFTLEFMGYVERSDNAALYSLGRSCLPLAYSSLVRNRFLETASPYLVQLADRTQTRCDLALLTDTEIIYLARYTSRDEISNLHPIGRKWPAALTSSGRAILSALPDEDCVDILKRSQLRAVTNKTNTNKDEILSLIREAREQGYGFQSEEVLKGAASIAAPVRAASGAVLGSVVIGGTPDRFETKAQRDEFFRALVQTTNAIETQYF